MSSTEIVGDGATERGNPLWWLFRRHGVPRWRQFAVGMTLSALGRFPQQAPAFLIGMAINAILAGTEAFRLPLVPSELVPTDQGGQLLLTGGLLVAAYGLETLFDFVARHQMGRFGTYFQHDVRMDVFDTVQRLELGFFDDRDTGDVMSVLNDDVDELNAFVYGTVSRGAAMVSLAVAAFVYMLWLQWQLAVVLLVVPAVLFALSYWFSAHIEPKHEAIRERVGELNGRLNNNVEGVSVIKAFGTERAERERVERASRNHLDAQWDAHRSQATVDPVMRVVSDTGRVLTLVLGGYWVISGQAPLFFTGDLAAGTLVSFLMYAGALVTPMQGITDVVDSYQNSKSAATRLREAVENDAVAEREGANDLADPEGAVDYEDVTFRYPGREEPTIDDVSFTVEPGETVGVVGPTGAGKSTLLSFLLRFYDPDEGTIRVDGHDVRDLTVESLRESVGYVSQDPFLFDGSVRENVAYAESGRSDDAVVEAAKLAGAHEFVTDLPEGYDTEVGERGVKLSGGQRQRIAIARAIVRDPAILIFDEATSHVDNETEVLIQRTLDNLAADRTTFLVAHRLSTVRDADRILVLDDGRLVESGTHDDLLAADGLYADLWRVQVGDVAALPDSFLERVRREEDVA
ncbi:ABC transporter ATP-binding protein/permease [Halobacteria archaeon HArc-gm2]|nr:ABC transporter ATP-binding protein/permease [Halobacteria archaeon HArc-gm2]